MGATDCPIFDLNLCHKPSQAISSFDPLGDDMEAIIDDLALLIAISTNAKLVDLYRYWSEKKDKRSFPARGDLDPLEFSYALGFVSLVDCVPRSVRFKYRLVSTNLTNRLGYDMTGKWADEIPDNYARDYVKDFYATVLHVRTPIYEKSERIFHNQVWKHEALALPLSDDNDNINMLLVYRETYDPKFAFDQYQRVS
jgi:hypothetical protein